MKSELPRIGPALILSAFVGSLAFAGEEKVIDLSEVPAEIVTVAEENFKGLQLAVADAPDDIDDGSFIDDNLVLAYKQLGEVTLVSANTETEEDGSFVYELQGKFPDGREVEIDIDPEGEVEEIEVEFSIEDVPGAVVKAIEKKMPGFKPEFIEASHSPSKKVTGYEFVGKMGEQDLDIEVSADGRRIEISDS